jgi:iron complex transport system substrate-binding protein
VKTQSQAIEPISPRHRARTARFDRRGLIWELFALFCSPSVAAEPQPARIVSTFPSITETVFALGAGDRLVGVSDYCRYPEAALALPKVGGYLKPNLEKIALLRPDLVLIRDTAATAATGLSALGIRYVQIKIGSLADVYSMIRDVGAAIGASANAQELNAKIRSRLDAMRTETASKPRPTVLIVVGHTLGLLTNLVAAGPSTYLSELLEIAGGRNTMPPSAIAYPRISLETIVRLNPDVILDLSTMGESASAEAHEARLRDPWLSRHELNAVRSGRVFELSSDPLATPGPRVVESVELIRAKLIRGKAGQTAGAR